MNMLTDEIKNGLTQGSKVEFKWHGSSMLYTGRIEINTSGEQFFVNEHEYEDNVLKSEGMRFYNPLDSFYSFPYFKVIH